MKMEKFQGGSLNKGRNGALIVPSTDINLQQALCLVLIPAPSNQRQELW